MPEPENMSESAITAADANWDETDGTIYFYGTHDEYGFFSNFARYPVVIRGHTWPTTEHYFQAQKFAGTAHEGAILHASSPAVAAHGPFAAASIAARLGAGEGRDHARGAA